MKIWWVEDGMVGEDWLVYKKKKQNQEVHQVKK
jgi:hypothetical protein